MTAKHTSIRSSIRPFASLALLPAAIAFSVCCAGPEATEPASSETSSAHEDWLREHYDKSEHSIAMRDGVELYTLVYRPKSDPRDLPILLFRTPYSIEPYGAGDYRSPLGPSEEFDRAGYIFAFQDVRGKFKSQGDFEVIRPLAAKPKSPTDVDESTDNYDTIEWLLENLEGHNGRVGQWGISYPGWQTVMGMVDAHPALVASSPQASPSDMFVGDDWHHNGAFRIMYAFSWLSGNARRRDQPTEQGSERFDYGTPWGYEFFRQAGAASNIDELYFRGEVPAWNDFMEHDAYDAYWQNQNALAHLEGIQHAILNVAGWFDTEDFYGPMSIYRTTERNNPGIENTLVVGPWLHGGWRGMEGDHLGCIEFGSPTSVHFQQHIQFPFFEHHLRGAEGWSATEAQVFVTGDNEWRTHHRWPPAGLEPTAFYLGEGGSLSDEPPTDKGGADTYVSDPNKPVPFSAEIRTTLGHLWKVEDQRFVSTRPDVLVYTSEPLTQDLTIAGPILANVWVSTTGTDSDWIVKLIDVYPGDSSPSPFCDTPMGGYQMHLAGEILRGRFRNSLEHPVAMTPGEPSRIQIDLRDRYHTFKAGHRIMVHIQSSWFPAYDMNPQTFVDTYRAQPADYRSATQTVYRSAQRPSHLLLGVVPED